MSLRDRFCGVCKNYMKLSNLKIEDERGNETLQTIRICSFCGNKENEKKGLVMETYLLEQASESLLLQVNEYTKVDPRLPHLTTLKCPNAECPSRTGQEKSDVVYKRYDGPNMKFLYMCNIPGCGAKWTSGS
jgi:hypothetical protein